MLPQYPWCVSLKLLGSHSLANVDKSPWYRNVLGVRFFYSSVKSTAGESRFQHNGDDFDGLVAVVEDGSHFDGLIGCEVFCGDQGSRQDAALGREVLVSKLQWSASAKA